MNKFNNLLVLKFGDVDYHRFHINEFKKHFKTVDVINYDSIFSENGIIGTEKYIEKFIAKSNINLIFIFLFVNNFEISLDFLNKLKETTYIVFWFFDDEVFFHSYNKFYAQVADAVITTSYYDRFAYEQLGIPAILYFSSYSKKEYHPQIMEKKIDVSFVGIMQSRPDRKIYIDYLLDNGINVQTFGSDFSTGFISTGKMVEIFSQSRINLNFTGIAQFPELEKDNPFLPIIKQNKGRPIEIALTKSFCLSESAPSIDKVFIINKEISVFNDKEELLGKIKYFLKNNRQREKIAESAYRKALQNYESSIYLKNVLNDLYSKLQQNNFKRIHNEKFYMDISFQKKYYSFLRTQVVFRFKKRQYKKLLIFFKDIYIKNDFLYCLGIITGFFIKRDRLFSSSDRNDY